MDHLVAVVLAVSKSLNVTARYFCEKFSSSAILFTGFDQATLLRKGESLMLLCKHIISRQPSGVSTIKLYSRRDCSLRQSRTEI